MFLFVFDFDENFLLLNKRSDNKPLLAWDGKKKNCEEKSFHFIKIVFLLLSLCLLLISYPYFHPYISQSCCTHRLFVILVYTGVLKCVCICVCVYVCVRVCKTQSVCLPICACVWMKRVWVWVCVRVSVCVI